ADADAVHAIAVRPSPQLLEVTVEPFDLGKEPHVEGVLVEHADGVVRIDRCDKSMAGVFDGFEVPWGDEARDAGHGKVHAPSFTPGPPTPRSAFRSVTSRSIVTRRGAFTCSE